MYDVDVTVRHYILNTLKPVKACVNNPVTAMHASCR